MSSRTSLCIGLFVAIFGFLSVSDADDATHRKLRLPDTPYRYADAPLPAHFRTPGATAFDNTPAENPMTDAGVLLGRVLFYDKRLSKSATISCASCHAQATAFSDSRQFSPGHAGQLGDRNSMSLVNLRFSKAGKFWDERVSTLEEQVLIPIQSRVEMGMNLDELVQTVEHDPIYNPLFKDAFGDTSVSSDRVAKALSQFLRALVSCSSKYDAGVAQVTAEADDFPSFSVAENLGKKIFLEKCAICHRDGRGRQSAFFTSFRSLNNGIDATADVIDAGNGDVTLVPSDVGLFRPPDLRNVEFTAPYMHDGRFTTLEQVVEHYSTGVERHPNVSGFAFRMHFTDQEKAAVVAFLKTLSDESFLKDPRFSNPWIEEHSDTTQAAAVAVKSQPAEVNRAKEISVSERADRLAKHIGLPPGQALLYLHDLDGNGDKSLDREETVPLAKLLLENGPPARFDRRRFAPRSLQIASGTGAPPAMMALDRNRDGRLSPDEMTDARREIMSVADSDKNGELSVEEVRRFETIERFISAQAGERDRTRMTRLLETLGLRGNAAETVRNAIQTTQEELAQTKDRLNQELSATLSSELGETSYAQFQELMFVNQDSQELSRRAGGITVETLQTQIFEFDDDKDGRLNEGELASLGRVLDETPGGFGTSRPSLPSIVQYRQRVMARDIDHDGVISVNEIPDRFASLIERGDADRDGRLSQIELDNYLRTTSYERFLQEGIYQSGTFLNAFSNSSRFIEKLELSDAQRDSVKTLIEKHERIIQSTIDAAVISACERVQAAQSASGGSRPKKPAER